MKTINDFSARLLRRILLGVSVATGLAPSACSQANPGVGGAGSGGSGGSGSGAATVSGAAVTSTSKTAQSSATSTASTTGSTSGSTGSGMMNVERCFGVPTNGCPALGDASTALGSCTNMGEVVLTWLSGPTVSATQCCYQVDVGNPGDPTCGVPGRPFVVDGRARVADIRGGLSGWTGQGSSRARHTLAHPLPDMRSLDGATSERLGREWAIDAAYEHASVASFSKLSLELIAFGAPSDLVRRTHEAALDEVRHAEIGFAMASAYLGIPISPSTLPRAVAFSGAASLVELAVAALREGCFGETLAAVVASEQHAQAHDPGLALAYGEIAEDEARHAELAFGILAWAIRVGGSEVLSGLHEAAIAMLAEIRRRNDRNEAAEESSLLIHGRLTRSELARAQLDAAETIVMPALRSLFEPGLPLEADEAPTAEPLGPSFASRFISAW